MVASPKAIIHIVKVASVKDILYRVIVASIVTLYVVITTATEMLFLFDRSHY